MTGGSGFLGSSVVPCLAAAGHNVVALARTPRAAHLLDGLGAAPIMGDLDDASSIDAAFAASHADVLVNLASLGRGHGPTVVAAAEEATVARAVFVSTTSIFTMLPSPSKPTRLAAEAEVVGSSLSWTIVRPTMIYGKPGDRNMARLLRGLKRVPVVPVPGGGAGLHQPVHVDDLAGAIVACVDEPRSIGCTYELAGPDPLTLKAVIEQAAQAVGRRPRCVSVPLKASVRAARMYESLVKRPRLSAEQVARLGENKAFDISAARRDLSFMPREFSRGIREEAAML